MFYISANIMPYDDQSVRKKLFNTALNEIVLKAAATKRRKERQM